MERYFSGWPCALVQSEQKGRYLVAAQDLAEGDVVLVSEAYLSIILNSHKKRVCSLCHQDCRQRLSICCGGCHQAYYCSAACQAAHSMVPPAELPLLPCSSSDREGAQGGKMAATQGGCLAASRGQQDSSGSARSPRPTGHTGGGNSCSNCAELGGPADHTEGRLSLLGSTGGARSSSSGTASGGSIDGAVSSNSSCVGSPAAAPPHSCSAGATMAPQELQQQELQQQELQQQELQQQELQQQELQQQELARARAPRSAAMVPHGLLCGVVRHLGSVKWSTDVESVLLGVLQLLAMEHLELHAGHRDQPRSWKGPAGKAASTRQCAAGVQPACAPGCGLPEGGWQQAGALARNPPRDSLRMEGPAAGAAAGLTAETAAAATAAAATAGAAASAARGAGIAGQAPPPTPSLPHLAHSDFVVLQSHAADWDEEDRRDWLKYATQLLGMLRKAGWTGQLPSPELVLDYAGRITSNNFGIFSPSALKAQVAAEGQLAKGDLQQEGPQGNVSPQASSCGTGAQAGSQRAGGTPAGATERISRAAGTGTQVQQPAQRAQQPREQQSREELIGRELYITASFFNHSCQPNCLVHRGFKTATVVARQAVQAGEELTISYIDLELPRPARRSHLLKYFYFRCDCPRCEQEAVEGSARCSYGFSKGKTGAPKRRGRKARVSR